MNILNCANSTHFGVWAQGEDEFRWQILIGEFGMKLANLGQRIKGKICGNYLAKSLAGIAEWRDQL